MEHEFKCDYQVFINSRFAKETDDEDEVWDIIGSYPCGSCYEVRSVTGKDTLDFVPF